MGTPMFTKMATFNPGISIMTFNINCIRTSKTGIPIPNKEIISNYMFSTKHI